MTNTQRNFLIAGAAGVLFFAGSLLDSHTGQAKGAYSTPVQVMNTSAAPVIGVDAEKLARIPYQSSQYSNTCSGLNGCGLQFTSPPPGYRLVIQHVSGFFWQAPGTTLPASFYLNSNLKMVLAAPSQIVQSTNGGVVFSMVNQDALVYFDAGSLIYGFAEGNWLSGQPVSVVLSGYLENCAITGCPAIQS